LVICITLSPGATPAETLNLLRRVRVEQLLQLDVERP
jgi:hypothetical protein